MNDYVKIGRNTWTIKENLFFRVGGRTVKVPSGFKWDGSSIGPTRNWNLAATLIHDYLYDKQTRPPWVTRKMADDVFFRMLRSHNAPWWYIMGAKIASLTVFPLAWKAGWPATR